MNASSELAQISTRLEQLSRRGSGVEITDPLDRLQRSAEEVGRSASGSWIGHHAFIYHERLEVPPPGAHFDREWGTLADFFNRTSGNWREYKPEEIVAAIRERAGNPDLSLAKAFDDEAREEIETCKSTLLSIIQIHLNQGDLYLEDIGRKVNDVTLAREADIVNAFAPSGRFATRDSLAACQGQRMPPHFSVIAEVVAINHTRATIANLLKLVNQMGEHLLRQTESISNPTTGNIFIGHGHSAAWHELKDFVQNRLGLSTDEFNRVPVAGVSNTERLTQMLNSAAMAFLVMTGEDEQQDGGSHARLNVVHEVGLFQGKLGFARAIVLLEEGCDEFSNIAGLGQLRFPKGQIQSTFEGVREVLEREGLVKDSNG